MEQSREAGREQARLVTLAETLAPTLAPTPHLTNLAMAIGYRSKRLFHCPQVSLSLCSGLAQRDQPLLDLTGVQ